MRRRVPYRRRSCRARNTSSIAHGTNRFDIKICDSPTLLGRAVVCHPDDPCRRSNAHRVVWKTVIQHPTERVLLTSSATPSSRGTLDTVTGTWNHVVNINCGTEISRAELQYILGLDAVDCRPTSGRISDNPNSCPCSTPGNERALSVGAVEDEERHSMRTQVDWEPYGPSSHYS